MKFSRRTFKNGLRALVAPMSGTSTVTILVLVGTGSNYENKELNGLSHFLEHMFFKGTKKYPKPGELDKLLDSVGAMHNAFTSREETGYWIKLGAEKFDLGLSFVSDILQNSLLKKEEIDRERGVIIEEMKMRKDNPRSQVWSLTESLIYGNNPYGWDIIGTQENIRAFSRQQFTDYWQSQYTASNTVVIVAGNIPEEDAFRKIEKSFSKLRDGGHKKQIPFKGVESGPRVSLFSKETDQSHIVLSALGYHLEHRDRYVVDVLSTILGGYMSSRLWSDIRGKKGLAYTVHAGHQAYRHTGYFAAYAGVPHEKSAKVVTLILDHLKRIKKSGITTEELKRAKDNIHGQTAISLESTDEVASFLGGQEILEGRVLSPEEILKKIDMITKEDIVRVARDIFAKDKLYLAIIGPNLQEAEYQSILNSF